MTGLLVKVPPVPTSMLSFQPIISVAPAGMPHVGAVPVSWSVMPVQFLNMAS